MRTGRKVIIGGTVVILLGTATALSLARSRDRGLPVRMEEVQRRDLVSTVTASGNIRARRTVDISSDISARVAQLLVREGEDVDAGRVLLRLDPSQYEAQVARARAALSQARAQEANQQAALLQAQRAYERNLTLHQRDSLMVSPQQLEDSETSLDVAAANLQSARFGVEQAEASLAEAEEQLAKTVIRAPMAGKITRLNVEEGETVIIGTMNNPGSLVLTVSDLSTVEVVVQVDETDVPQLELGDSSTVDIDAFPRQVFTGRITEIGNSAIQPPSATQASGQQGGIDFEVVITLDDTPVVLRPDLSATAEIVTETRNQVLSIPIIALTVRSPDEVGQDPDGAAAARDTGDATAGAGGSPRSGRSVPDDVEGVFVVREGRAVFVPVEVGIAGREHFEILSGVEEGDTVVAGPYQVIRELRDGDPVIRQEERASAAVTGG